jgi:hypothetical protein
MGIFFDRLPFFLCFNNQWLGFHDRRQDTKLEGLGVLPCLSSLVKETNELILSKGGLDMIIAAMTIFEDNIEMAQRGCKILKTFTRQSLDF